MMKIMTQKLKVTPLIFNENFENDESKNGGGGALVENSTFFFKPSLRHYASEIRIIL